MKSLAAVIFFAQESVIGKRASNTLRGQALAFDVESQLDVMVRTRERFAAPVDVTQGVISGGTRRLQATFQQLRVAGNVTHDLREAAGCCSADSCSCGWSFMETMRDKPLSGIVTP